MTAISSTSAFSHLLPFAPGAQEASAAKDEAYALVLTSRQALVAARAGDRDALAAFLRALQDPWYRMALSMLRDADLAAEAVQETGLRFLKQIVGFRGDSQIRTWSLGIAINVVREMKRRRFRSGGGDQIADLGGAVGVPATAVSEPAELDEQRSALRLVINDLPDRQREAVVLRYFEDLSVDDTARIMGCAAGTVKATVHQALRSLRKRLGDWK